MKEMKEAKETGLILKAPAVLAILEGRKTQHRFFSKEFNGTSGLDTILRRFPKQYGCPLGQTGDRVYVRETWMDLHSTGVEYRPDPAGPVQRYAYAADVPPESYSDQTRADYGLKWKPSSQMPKDAARIWLEITDIRVERLQDISEEDCLAEGVNRISHGREGYFYSAVRNDADPENWIYPDDAFRELWESTVGGWDANPWVWVPKFKVLSTTGRPK